MVAWETQLEERSVPAWRDKYVRYSHLKRKLDQVIAAAEKARRKEEEKDKLEFMVRALSCTESPDMAETAAAKTLQDPLLKNMQQRVDAFMEEVHLELKRVSTWYSDEATALEAKVRKACSRLGDAGGAAALRPGSETGAEELGRLHLEASQLTEFALLNVEALRKIVKKMDKTCDTKEQKSFVEKSLKQSPFATPGNDKTPFDGDRARQCRKHIEAFLSPELIAELRSRALTVGVGAGHGHNILHTWRVVFAAVVAVAATLASAKLLDGKGRAQRCVVLVVFTVSMWVLEAAPFEATALFVVPLATVLNVLEGDTDTQARAVLGSVFSESLYMVLCGFCLSSVFSRCQLEYRVADFLQQRFATRPFVFMLAIMFLGLFLSSLLTNITAPLLLVEVLKPMLKEAPTDTRFSRILLLGLAFACNLGGAMTPISSAHNVAALALLRQHGSDITWAQWLSVSIPFCCVGTIVGWGVLMLVYRFDLSPEEAARIKDSESDRVTIPAVVFEQEPFTQDNMNSLALAFATLFSFACKPTADFFGGTAMIAMLFVSVCVGTGIVPRQSFDSYSWHLLFLIGGGSALGFCVNGSGLLQVITHAAQAWLSSEPTLLTWELVAVMVVFSTLVSHTVSALVMLPLVYTLGSAAGCPTLAVFVVILACSMACALPMSSFPNVNSLMAVDDLGKPWLGARHFIAAGVPLTVVTTCLLATYGYTLAEYVVAQA